MYDLLQNPVLCEFRWSVSFEVCSDLPLCLAEELVSTLHNRYGVVGTPAEGAIGGSTDFVRSHRARPLELRG